MKRNKMIKGSLDKCGRNQTELANKPISQGSANKRKVKRPLKIPTNNFITPRVKSRPDGSPGRDRACGTEGGRAAGEARHRSPQRGPRGEDK